MTQNSLYIQIKTDFFVEENMSEFVLQYIMTLNKPQRLESLPIGKTSK